VREGGLTNGLLISTIIDPAELCLVHPEKNIMYAEKCTRDFVSIKINVSKSTTTKSNGCRKKFEACIKLSRTSSPYADPHDRPLLTIVKNVGGGCFPRSRPTPSAGRRRGSRPTSSPTPESCAQQQVSALWIRGRKSCLFFFVFAIRVYAMLLTSVC
jgi:hypothetical protein